MLKRTREPVALFGRTWPTVLCMIALIWWGWIDSVPFKIICFGYFCFVQHSEVKFDKYALYCWKSLKCKTKNVVLSGILLEEPDNCSDALDKVNFKYSAVQKF